MSSLAGHLRSLLAMLVIAAAMVLSAPGWIDAQTSFEASHGSNAHAHVALSDIVVVARATCSADDGAALECRTCCPGMSPSGCCSHVVGCFDEGGSLTSLQDEHPNDLGVWAIMHGMLPQVGKRPPRSIV